MRSLASKLLVSVFAAVVASPMVAQTEALQKLLDGGKVEEKKEKPAKKAVPKKRMESAAKSLPPLLISNGTPITFQEKGITIVPPVAWEVYKNYGGSSLMMQAPNSIDEGYQRAITVLRFTKPFYIDDIGAKNFEPKLIKKLSEASADIQNFRVRNHMLVDLPNGTKGILYYTDFSLGGLDLMQVHILTSSATNHYLLSYTDLAKHFEADQSPHLNTAWQTLTSIKLDSKGPSRIGIPYAIGIGLGLILLLAAMIGTLRRWMGGRQYNKIASEYGDKGWENNPQGDGQENWQQVEKYASESKGQSLPDYSASDAETPQWSLHESPPTDSDSSREESEDGDDLAFEDDEDTRAS